MPSRISQLKESFWALPTLMAVSGALAAVVSTSADEMAGRTLVSDYAWAWSGSAEGARSVLSVIAGSTMTVAGVVFSITVTALAQTSSHFGPRVLRNFTADRGNQLVLGTFIGTFVFCLLVLRSVSAEGESQPASVPFLSVNLGLLFAVASIGVLIYFIHHIARSLQVEVLLANVGAEFDASLATLFPDQLGEGRDQAPPQLADPGGWERATPVSTGRDGYVQGIDQAELMALAEAGDLRVIVDKRPGDFVRKKEPVLRVQWPGAPLPAVRRKLAACVQVGVHRTPQADISYSVQQLVEVAARGLSPGVNEVFTALSCIDWLGSALDSLAGRRLPQAARADRHGHVRVIATPTSLVDLADLVFDTLRPYAAEHALIAHRLLYLIEDLAPRLHRAADAHALQRHARRVAMEAERLRNTDDRAAVALSVQRCASALDVAVRRLDGVAGAQTA